jgi:MFS family permease
MSPPPGRPKEGSLPPGGKARSAKGAHIGPPRGRPKEGSLPLGGKARSAKGALEATVSPHVKRLLIAKGLRAFGDGYVSLLLPLYLLQLGFSPLQVGIIATTTLFGSGLLTLLVGLHAYRYHYRTLLLAATLLMAGTGLGFAVLTDFWPLLLIALVGTLNPSSGDVSVFLPLEHAVLSRVVDDKKRTAVFARYSLVGSLAAAFGALVAAAPSVVASSTGISGIAALQSMFVLYALLAGLSALVYRELPRALESETRQPQAPLEKSKKNVYTLAALFSLDAFGGGFVVQSMVALWLYQRFSLSLAVTSTVFFWTGVLTAFSYLVAVRIADRFGLVNTMVFTHLPANLCLILIPFMPDVSYAITLLFVRSALSQMDVPTRSSYVMAIVPPVERPAAASITSVPRSLASAASPLLSGYLLGLSSFGWPLVAAGAVKIVYDLLLLTMFRKVRPPEEHPRVGSSSPAADAK